MDVRLLKDQNNQQPQAILTAILKNYADSNPEINFPPTDDGPAYYLHSRRELLEVKVVRNNPDDFLEEFEAVCNSRRWKIILRLCTHGGKQYLVRGYVQADKYERAQKEIEEAMNSFKPKD